LTRNCVGVWFLGTCWKLLELGWRSVGPWLRSLNHCTESTGGVLGHFSLFILIRARKETYSRYSEYRRFRAKVLVLRAYAYVKRICTVRTVSTFGTVHILDPPPGPKLIVRIFLQEPISMEHRSCLLLLSRSYKSLMTFLVQAGSGVAGIAARRAWIGAGTKTIRTWDSAVAQEVWIQEIGPIPGIVVRPS
jgi:hypothetical protein